MNLAEAIAILQMKDRTHVDLHEAFARIDRAKEVVCKAVASGDMIPVSELDTMQAERDSYRAVLVGAEYGDIEGIGKQIPETSRLVGATVKWMTMQRIRAAEIVETDRDRLAAENASMRSQLAAIDSQGKTTPHG